MSAGAVGRVPGLPRHPQQEPGHRLRPVLAELHRTLPRHLGVDPWVAWLRTPVPPAHLATVQTRAASTPLTTPICSALPLAGWVKKSGPPESPWCCSAEQNREHQYLTAVRALGVAAEHVGGDLLHCIVVPPPAVLHPHHPHRGLVQLWLLRVRPAPVLLSTST